MMRATRPRLTTVAVSAFLAALFLLVPSWSMPPAWGHPYLVQTEPSPGVALPNTPAVAPVDYDGQIVQARTLVTQDPARVAQVVKTWVGNDE